MGAVPTATTTTAMTELRVVVTRKPLPIVWMSLMVLDFTRFVGGTPMLMARWRWTHTGWTRTY